MQQHVNLLSLLNHIPFGSFWLIDVFQAMSRVSPVSQDGDSVVPSEREPTCLGRGSSQHSEHSAESSLEDENIVIEQTSTQINAKIANYIAKMEVINPEVMRVTYAFCAFQNAAKALRVGKGKFYHKSFKSDKISTFWSHSWHGGHWKKILTLLTFYNAPAALFCGFLTAILMMILYCLQILPGFDRQFKNFGLYSVYFSLWCVSSGFVVTILVMLFWRSHTKVFFDRLCISQDNPELKAQAIFSLAGLLKNSDVMLILWDAASHTTSWWLLRDQAHSGQVSARWRSVLQMCCHFVLWQELGLFQQRFGMHLCMH